ncbi:ARM repeat-containing protein [Lentinula aff. lateritia]|uniref:ARM repeat-containing protein n=1 Tax=Lentinula aff. lateritia TaxID=2804960 RepID=A0ACC1U843_9AGAR|nr:ARM repeat-containing protein [Lentinula aff. lateritia]
MIPPQLPPALLDKKRELSYTLNIQQQLVAQALMFPRSNSSPHLPIYPTNMEYSQLPLMMPNGPLYGSNLAAQMFHQGMQQNTRGVLQSPLLLEFHANKTRNWELRDIMNHVVEFSGDQHGSRLIQHKLESASSEEKQKVFEEIVPHNVLQLIQDIFGNYVIQKLFEHGTQVQKSRLAAAMEGHILPLSKQMYGCRVVQKAIEYILPEQQVIIVHELEPHIMECIHDANGNHVIQKIIERVSPDRLGFVYGFRGNVQSLATHTFGCRVLQRALEYLPEVITAPLIEELHASTLLLMQNQFGNYVIQFVIEHAKPQDSAIVVSKLRGRLLVMARHKFASNVCEKALTFAHPETRRQLIDEILSPRPEGAVVLSMMKDQYANYVLQSAVRIADADQRESLINQIRPQLAVLLRISNGYSKHLVSSEHFLFNIRHENPSSNIYYSNTSHWIAYTPSFLISSIVESDTDPDLIYLLSVIYK